MQRIGNYRRLWQVVAASLTTLVLFSQVHGLPDSAAETSANAGVKPIPAELVTAIRNGDKALVRKLLDGGADVNARDAHGNTPLILASLYAQADVVELLLQKKADPNAANKEGATALIRGAADAEKVRLLLAAGANAKVATKNLGNTPLILAARRHGNSQAVKLLLDKGADVKARNRRGVSAILAAAASGDIESVRLLLDHKADVNDAPTAKGDDMIWSGLRTPLMWAAYTNDLPMLRFLLERGADVNKQTMFGSPLTQAAWHDSLEAAQLLLDKKARANARDFAGYTPLHWAASTDSPRPELVKLLLAKGADPNAVGGDPIPAFLGEPQTPLMLAQKRGATPIVAALREAGAKPAPPMQTMATPKRMIKVDQAAVIEAAEQAVANLQATAAASRGAFVKHISKQQCASCHQQYLPMAAVGHARARSIRIDKEAARKEVEMLAYFEPDRSQPVFHPEAGHSYGYEAFALAAEKAPAGGTGTDTLVHHLAAIQAADGRWFNNLPRPPLQSSDIAPTALAIQALATFGWEGRRAEFTAAIGRAKKWLWTVQAETNEEATYQLLGLHWASETPEKLAGLTKALVARQRDDGGWSQLPTLKSDAYATGQALYALSRASQLDSKDDVWRNGAYFLVVSQHRDGSWYAPRRAFPFQPTMPSGFPHGRDSWLSASATSWAVMALSQSLPPGTAAGDPEPIGTSRPQPVKSTDKIDFARQIKPLLERSCVACHGAEKPRSNYRVDRRATLVRGGVSGEAAIVPGQSDKSPLLDYVAGRSLGMEMPPLHKRQQFPAISQEELQMLRTWIDQGAAWPENVVLGPQKREKGE